MGNDQGKMGGSATPAGIQSMDESLQKKFSKGIQFNMKIVLKGDRNTGKTCLFNRMEGRPFSEAYIPTTEIQVTSIHWSYKVTSDTVKVEVWDVVDKGKVAKKERKGSLKIFNTQPDEEDGEGEGGEGKKVLDATFLDVYKGCHGVVLVFDMTKMWTWKYVERELPNIPYDIPVIVLANFRDLGEHRAVTRDEVMMFIETSRPDGSSEVMYAESSMKNAFGLMHLHKFLSIPFLQMQQDMLLQQIQVSREQMLAAREELTTAAKTEDQNYDMFVTRLQQSADHKRRKAQQQQEALESSDSATGTPRLQQRAMDPEQTSIRSSSSTSSAPPTQATPTPGAPAQRRQSSEKKSRLSNLFSRNRNKSPESSKGPIPVAPRGTGTGPAAYIEDFVPEGDVDSFLEYGEAEEEEEEDGGGEEESEEEESHPMVARDEDLSSAEEENTSPLLPKPALPGPSPVVKRDKPVTPPVQLKSAKDVELTESEEEEEEEEGERNQAVPEPAEKRKKDLELFWGKPGEKGNKTPSTGGDKSKQKAKSGGLLLDWAIPTPTTTATGGKSSKKEIESPDLGEGGGERKERRKKRSSRKGSKKKKQETEEGGAVTNGATTDPYASLDAWLNSEDTGILQPTMSPLSGRGGGGEEVGRRWEGRGIPHHGGRRARRTERGQGQRSLGRRRSTSHTTRARRRAEFFEIRLTC